ncbi:MAG: hypothetical protein ABIR46_03875 [Candidatus Saccharimonadales bacterium]
MSLNIEQALEMQERYQASDDVRKALGGTALIAFVGPTATGKNFLMHASGLHIAGTETTRGKRESDDPVKYRYSSVDDMLGAIESRHMVQYGVAPPHIYASRLQDYQLDRPNVSDIWFDAVHPLHNKGFSTIRMISVLTRKEQYKARLEMRLDGMQVHDALKRLDNDRYSLRWTIAQLASQNPNHLVIMNDADTSDDVETVSNVDQNAQKIHDFAHGKSIDNPDEDLVAMVIDEMHALLQSKYGNPKRLDLRASS